MQVVWDFFEAVKNILIAFLVSWFHFFIPPTRKCVSGEIVLVTGAARGMGQAIAVEFAKLGAIVVLWDVSEKGLEDTAKQIHRIGGKCHIYVCDISDRNQVQCVGERVRTEVGDVTILINSAGVVVGKKLLELLDEEIEQTFNVNLLGQIWTTKQFLPSMLENNHGHIVNMSSSCGHIGLSQLVDYSASKFGVVGFTQTLNYEIYFSGHDGVHTTLVSPSFVKTGMFAGCEMTYPMILPALEQQQTVDRIMQAILTNQNEVCVPRLVYLMATLKHMLPVKAMLEIIHFFRAEKFMDSFIGRKEEDGTLHKEE